MQASPLASQHAGGPVTAEVTVTMPHNDSPGLIVTAIHGKDVTPGQVAAPN